MHLKTLARLTLAALVAGGGLLHATLSEAAPIAFRVEVVTSALVGNAAGPFALDFQLIGGTPLANSAVISNFTFTGGAATAAPPATTFGLATGSLASSATLSDNAANFFNEFYQGFAPGSRLSFDVALSGNVNGPTPDSFVFAILDGSLFNIPTSGLGDALLLVNMDRFAPVVQTFSGTGAFSAVTVTATAVPEPATLVLLGAGLLGVAAYRRTRRAA